MLEELELGEIQGLMDEMLGANGFSLKETVAGLMEGGSLWSRETLSALIRDTLFAQLLRERELVLQILLLVIAAAVLTNVARVFDNGQIGEISFYSVYLLLFLLLVQAFQTLSRQLEENLSVISTFMNGLTPAYFAAVAASSGGCTAAAFYQGVLVLTAVIQRVLLRLLLPGCNLYVLLSLVNHLSKEPILSKLAELLHTGIAWALKTLLGIVVGMQVVQGLVSPAVDALRRSVLGRTAGAIPGLGGAANTITEILLGSAVLVRNCLGAAFLLALLLWGIPPVIRYGTHTLLYRLLAAAAQPMSDTRIVGCLSTVGDGCALLLRILFTAQILSMLTILVLAATFGGRG